MVKDLTDDELIARIVASIAGTRYLSKGPRGEVAELVRRYRAAFQSGYNAGRDEGYRGAMDLVRAGTVTP
jgi:hypothetical protein